MRAIYIGQNSKVIFENLEIRERFVVPLTHSNEPKTISELAKAIVKKISSDESIPLVIQTELCRDENDDPSQLLGVKLLKWLRVLHKVVNPIVLLGFLEVNQILNKHPEHLIITAPGNLYQQLPFSKDKLKSAIERVSPIVDLSTLYKPFLKVDFDIEAFGHSFANRFGIYVLGKFEKLRKGLKFKHSYFTEDEIYEFEKSLIIYDNPRLELEADIILKYAEEKRVLYIDDQAYAGWSNLLESMFSESKIKLESLQPKESKNFTDEILETCKIFMPELILLDLRLQGEQEKDKDFKDISGYKTLLKLKKEYPHIPVIIFSATNKATSFKKLSEAGAFNLWTKPRIETGFNIHEKYNDLLSLVDNALANYTLQEEKIPILTDFKIKNLGHRNYNFKTEEFFSQFDIIITDTNCWMYKINDKQGNSLENVSNMLKNLAVANHYKGRNGFIVIDDVLRELLGHNYKMPTRSELENENYDKKINVITSTYGLSLLNKLIRESNIFVYEEHIVNDFGRRFIFEYELKNNEIIEYAVEWQKDKYVDVFDRVYYNLSGKSIDEQNKILKNLNKRNKVHADEAFINIIFNYLNQNSFRKQNILFISNDTECIDNIFNLLKIKLKNIELHEGETRFKNGITKVRSGVIDAVNNFDEDISVTCISPMTFSNELEKIYSLND